MIDVDVKFRTGEINTGQFIWREGMDEWKPIFEVPELKSLLQGEYFAFNQTNQQLESTNELTPAVTKEL